MNTQRRHQPRLYGRLISALAVFAVVLVVAEARVDGTTPDLKVAFIADQGNEADTVAVLELIVTEGADLLMIQGDLDYNHDPTGWDNQVSSILGSNFPVVVSIGSHDRVDWTGTAGYQEKLQDRVDRIPDLSCTGDLGIMSTCSYQGLFMIPSGAGTRGSDDDHATYIRDQLAADDSTWSVCSWHRPQAALTVGDQNDAPGWGVYEECRLGGAMIVTGHEHTYHRTRTLVSTELQTVDADWPDPDDVRVAEGSTFVAVSGLGGRSVRNQDRCLPVTFPYGCNQEWASIYTSDQGASSGALFCTFNAGGQFDRADCYFKDIAGVTPDVFTVTSFMGDPPIDPIDPDPPIDPGEACPTGPIPFIDVLPTSFAYADIQCIFGLGITTGTSTNTYSPNELVTREQMAAFVARTYEFLTGTACRTPGIPFTDVYISSFAYFDVRCIFGLEITTGTTPSTFSPSTFVTREQMAAFIARTYAAITGSVYPFTTHPFLDVSPTSFAFADIGRIYGLDITKGTSPTTYSPDDHVTREQMAAFLARLIRILHIH